MDIKQYITLTIGLIVGVLLIAGVVTPVIASMSSDDGGSGNNTDSGDNSEKNFYRKASANDSLTLWAWYDNDGPDDADNTYICDGNPEGADPVTKWESYLPCLIGEDWYMELGASGSIEDMSAYFTVHYSVEYDFGENNDEEGQYVEINGTDVTIYNIWTNESATYHNLLYYSYPEGDFVSCISYGEDEDTIIQPYLDNTSDIAIPISLFLTDDGMCDLMIYGTPADNSVELVKEYNDVNISSYELTANISIQNGKLTGISIVVDDVTYAVDVVTYSTGPDQDVILRNLIVPCVTDAGSNIDGGGSGSGGSSGLSPTLTTILSVIPLVMVVGLIISAVAFIRFKE